jgi:hypothetical protein
MVVRLSALRTRRTLLPRTVFKYGFERQLLLLKVKNSLIVHSQTIYNISAIQKQPMDNTSRIKDVREIVYL